MTQPTTSDPDDIAAKVRAKLDTATAEALAGIDADTDAATTAALREARAETVLARDDADAATSKAGKVTAAWAGEARQAIDRVAAPDYLAAAEPVLGGGYMAVARKHVADAAKDATFKKVEALLRRLPEDQPKRMVERVVIRAYAQGSSTSRAFLRHLVTLTKNTPPAHLEAQVEVALRIHAAECDAEVRDLWDVYAASVAQVPGRELATVRTQPMRRVAGLGQDGGDGAIFAGHHDHGGWDHDHPMHPAAQQRHEHPLAAEDEDTMVVLDGPDRYRHGAR